MFQKSDYKQVNLTPVPANKELQKFIDYGGQPTAKPYIDEVVHPKKITPLPERLQKTEAEKQKKMLKDN